MGRGRGDKRATKRWLKNVNGEQRGERSERGGVERRK